jgi:hypothetical protein
MVENDRSVNSVLWQIDLSLVEETSQREKPAAFRLLDSTEESQF